MVHRSKYIPDDDDLPFVDVAFIDEACIRHHASASRRGKDRTRSRAPAGL